MTTTLLAPHRLPTSTDARFEFRSRWTHFWLDQKGFMHLPNFTALRTDRTDLLLFAVEPVDFTLSEFVISFNKQSDAYYVYRYGNQPLERIFGLDHWTTLALQRSSKAGE